ncbi:SIS domain-containing protein [Candidatus Poriferisodalis sp.]|uniref:SIS domain-containing protein n=1 Tax=Candidatus Poriferisodalis sp. TaxID=3101277 RepID=UPI003B013B4A
MTSPHDDASAMTAAEAAVDSLDLARAVADLPEQMEAALASSEATQGPVDGSRIANVVVMGMGGSGVAGDIVSALAAPLMPVPVTVVKGYECPAFVGPTTLVIAVSFSGNTEETLEAATAAHDAGASVIAVTSGGRLTELAGEWAAPLYEVDSAIPMPRAAVGAISVAPLVALERAGLLSGVAGWVDAAVAQLRARRDAAGAGADSLESIVRAVGNGELTPVFYGGGALGAVAAGRAKAQINENAKIPAFASFMPELCHNELAGWDQAGRLVDGSPLAVIALRHDFEHPQLGRRYDFASGVFDDARIAVPHAELHAAGDGAMAQLFDLIYQVDVLSLRVAAAARRDPGPIPLLEELKAFLA